MNPQDRTRRILRSTLDAESRLVAIAVADHMDTHDETWVSAPTLAAETDIAERTVREILQHGEATGWLTREGRAGTSLIIRIGWDRLGDTDRPGRTTGKRKTANPCARRTPAPGAPLRPSTDTPAPGAGGPLRPAPQTPAPGAPEAIREATIEAIREAPNAGARAPNPSEPNPSQPAAEGDTDSRRGRVTPNLAVLPLRAPASPADGPPPIEIDGVTVPGDLPGLLGGMPRWSGLVTILVRGGIETSRRLLSLSRKDLKIQGAGLTPARIGELADHLRAAYGLELGCLEAVVVRGASPPGATTWVQRFAPRGGKPCSTTYLEQNMTPAEWEAWRHTCRRDGRGVPVEPDADELAAATLALEAGEDGWSDLLPEAASP